MQIVDKINKLTRHIASATTSGCDLRDDKSTDAIYFKMRAERAKLRTQERQALQDTTCISGADAGWKVVYDLALSALTAQTKDLEIAAWLAEALLRMANFAGLAAGFKLLHALVQYCWETLHPLPDAEGLITRLAPLVGLNGEAVEGTLIVPLALIPLTEGHNDRSFALWHYLQIQTSDVSNPKHACVATGAAEITLDKFKSAIAETTLEFLQNRLRDIQDCIAAFEQLNVLLVEKAGPTAPPASKILKQLQACASCVQNMLVHKKSHAAIAISVPQVAEAMPCQPLVDASIMSVIESTAVVRTQQLETILRIAKFFKLTEPHSPTAYLLERAVKLAQLTLPELLNELIADETTLKNLFGSVGMPMR